MTTERPHGFGAKKLNPLYHWFHKKTRAKLGKTATPFGWTKGYDVRDAIGAISIKNQGVNSSCGGQAGSYFLEIQRRLQKIEEGAVSAKSVYAPIHAVGGGTTVPQLEKQIGTKGGNLEVSVPSNDAYGNPLAEFLMEDTSWMTPQTSQDALGRGGFTLFDIGENIDDVAATIRDWGCVIWEICGQNNQTWDSSCPQPPSSTNPNELWYHFQCAISAIAITPTEYKGLQDGIITIDDLKQKYAF